MKQGNDITPCCTYRRAIIYHGFKQKQRRKCKIEATGEGRAVATLSYTRILCCCAVVVLHYCAREDYSFPIFHLQSKSEENAIVLDLTNLFIDHSPLQLLAFLREGCSFSHLVVAIPRLSPCPRLRDHHQQRVWEAHLGVSGAWILASAQQ